MSAYEMESLGEISKLIRETGDQVKVQGLRTRKCFKDYECSHQVAELNKRADTLDKSSAGAFGNLMGLVGNNGKAIKSLTGAVTARMASILQIVEKLSG